MKRMRHAAREKNEEGKFRGLLSIVQEFSFPSPRLVVIP